ncbi:DNA-binding transcriptional LysR family regulator [Paenibacillus castaneae]|uniref:LysR family transcriptional regulator n=1 Tax=Paenibacillus castaneae TaxID=474957 RepID=UPI000C9AF7F6|nr:LysR family transcriptional regulator [Paenibacillus castaneae]NIK76751.1 DNA-binding transcriptional LysR family regulator [Paenibacillus castaneae]
MNINLEWYRIFLYTAQSGNLTRAAEELHITQPSVSYAIKQLEAALGVKLFDRLSKGVRLTAEGASLFVFVEKSIAFLEAGEQKLRSLKDLTAGELRIGASGPIIKHVLLPQLDLFHAEHPDVRIRLAQGKTSEIRNRLKEGQIDLGLVHLPLYDEALDVSPLLAIQDCFVVGPAFKKYSEQVITSEQFIQIPLLLLTPGSSTRGFVDQWLISQGLEAEADIELSSMDMLIELAERGYGAAFVTESFVKQELEQGKLFRLNSDKPIPTRTIGIATRRNTSLSLIAQRFIELLNKNQA